MTSNADTTQAGTPDADTTHTDTTTADTTVVRVQLPTHLRTLAKVDHEVRVDVEVPVTQARVLDGLEAAYPVLRGTVRDRTTGKRRAFVRFFVGEEDRSHDAPDEPLPDEVATGEVPFVIIGAMAGG